MTGNDSQTSMLGAIDGAWPDALEAVRDVPLDRMIEELLSNPECSADEAADLQAMRPELAAIRTDLSQIVRRLNNLEVLTRARWLAMQAEHATERAP